MSDNQVAAEQGRNLFRVIMGLSVCPGFSLYLQRQCMIDQQHCQIHEYSIKACIIFMASLSRQSKNNQGKLKTSICTEHI